MKMKNYEIEQSIIVLSTLAETGELGYAIARNTRKLKEEASDYLTIRDRLLQKYGVLGNDGVTYTVPPESIQEYLAELGNIPTIEHDVDIYQVPADIFFSGSLISQQMEVLLWMVRE